MEISIGRTGQLCHDKPQQKWLDENNPIMQTSLFAGQEMAIQKSNDEPEIYDLHYLGLTTSGLDSMEAAKIIAPEFAKDVLFILSNLIDE